MNDYIFFMHDDAAGETAEGAWVAYFSTLRRDGRFNGGSAIGDGVCVRKLGLAPEPTRRIVGYIRVSANSLEEARDLVRGNPVFEAGGTIEICELPRTE